MDAEGRQRSDAHLMHRWWLSWGCLRAGAGLAADRSEVSRAAAIAGRIQRREMEPADDFTDEHRHSCVLAVGHVGLVRAVSAIALIAFGSPLAALLQTGRNQQWCVDLIFTM